MSGKTLEANNSEINYDDYDRLNKTLGAELKQWEKIQEKITKALNEKNNF